MKTKRITKRKGRVSRPFFFRHSKLHWRTAIAWFPLSAKREKPWDKWQGGLGRIKRTKSYLSAVLAFFFFFPLSCFLSTDVLLLLPSLFATVPLLSRFPLYLCFIDAFTKKYVGFAFVFGRVCSRFVMRILYSLSMVFSGNLGIDASWRNPSGLSSIPTTDCHFESR